MADEPNVFGTETPVADPSTTPDTSVFEKRLKDKDEFIERLKQETATAREAVAAQERRTKALEELLAKNTAETHTNQDPRPTPGVEAPSDADLAERISRLTKQEREQERLQVNIDAVAKRLVEVYGSEEKAREVVAAKAKELGVSTKFLQQVAQASPNAFFKQLDLSSTTKPIVPNTFKSTVNSEALGRNNQSSEPAPNTYSYFQRIKETEGMSKFLSPSVQNAMHKAVMEVGEEAFYKT